MRLDDPFQPVPPPGQADLPFDDGEPMDSPRHRVQMQILIESLEEAWRERRDFYVGGNMFVYFSELQIKGHEFRGPDVFVVLDTERKDRRAWVAWEEGGRLPDVVIELISESTAHVDRGEKKRVYAKVWRLPEYFIFDPHTAQLEAYRLDSETRDYVPALPDQNGDYAVPVLGLRLGIRTGRFHLHEGRFLRWIGPNGEVLPTPLERADAEQQRADAEQQRADAEQQRADAERQRADEAEARLEKLLEKP